jgi:hypothetical protein
VSFAMYTAPPVALMPSRCLMLCSTDATADSCALATSHASCNHGGGKCKMGHGTQQNFSCDTHRWAISCVCAAPTSSQLWASMPPSPSTIFSPLSATGLWDAVIMTPII